MRDLKGAGAGFCEPPKGMLEGCLFTCVCVCCRRMRDDIRSRKEEKELLHGAKCI